MKMPVRVVNPTPIKRFAMATAVVPFQPGEYVADDWRLEQVEPFGLLHDSHTHDGVGSCTCADGDVRLARVRFPVWMEPGEERDEVLPRMPAEAAAKAGLENARVAPFHLHDNLRPEILMAVKLELRSGDHPPLNLLARPQHVADASGFLVQTYRCTNRMPGTPIWAEFTLEFYAAAPYARWWLWWGYSDTLNTDRTWNSLELNLHVDGCKLVLHNEAASSYGHMMVDGGEFWVLETPAAGTIADGQSKMLSGALLFGGAGSLADDANTLEAEALLPVLAIADWTKGDQYGPLGRVPPAPPWLDNDGKLRELVRAMAGDEWSGDPKQPWDKGAHICLPNPGAAGAQPGFGNAALGADVRARAPWRLHGILRSVYQEACRTMNHRDPKGRMIREQDHGDLCLDGGVPHPRSKDLLGKEAWGKVRPRGGHVGHDLEHYVLQALLEVALVTGDTGALRLVENQAEVWLCSWFLNNRGTSHHEPGRPDRTVGRCTRTGAWLLFLTGREDLRERLMEKDGQISDEAVVRPRGKDPRHLDGRVEYIPYWEVGIQVQGLQHAHALGIGNNNVRTLAVARDLAMVGFIEEGGRWGVPYSTSAVDPKDHDGISWGLTRWALGAVALGLQWAIETNDDEWQRRCRLILNSHRLKGDGEGWPDLLHWDVWGGTNPALDELTALEADTEQDMTDWGERQGEVPE